MPNNLIKKVCEKCNISIDRAEHLWSQAEDIATKQYHKPNNYQLITSIFKHSLGKDCLNKLNWAINESITMADKEPKHKKKKLSLSKDPSNNFNADSKNPEDGLTDGQETALTDKIIPPTVENNQLLFDISNLIEEGRLGQFKLNHIDPITHKIGQSYSKHISQPLLNLTDKGTNQFYRNRVKPALDAIITHPLTTAAGAITANQLYDYYRSKTDTEEQAKEKANQVLNYIKDNPGKVGAAVGAGGLLGYGIAKQQEKNKQQSPY